MGVCSVTKRLVIERGGIGDYEALAHYHYRDGAIGPYAAIYAIRPGVGVIVYAMPSTGLELRNAATRNIFSGFDRATQLALINKNIRCISRVIIEPRYRGLGLAVRLVRETMPLMNVPIVEAAAVMGQVNPFFEKAGMAAYTAPMSAKHRQMLEAFSMVGIEENELIDAELVERRLNALGPAQSDFIEFEIREFLESYGKRRCMVRSQKRTEFVLGKLTARPTYYIWFSGQHIADSILRPLAATKSEALISKS